MRDNIPEVTFANFIDIFKNMYPFNLDYTHIAEYFGVNERTLLRWRNGEYRSVQKKNYIPLFRLLEKGITEEHKRVEFLVDAFHMPRQYSGVSYADLKETITRTLNSRLTGTELPDPVKQGSSVISVQSTKAFLKECLDKRISIKCIYMAFHSGWYWWDDHEMTRLLKALDSEGVDIYVIANPESTIKQIAMAMRNPDLVDFYYGFDETLAKWHEWEKKLQHLHFRVCEYPLFRKITIVEYADGEREAVFRDYVYNYSHNVNDHNLKLTEEDSVLDVFQREYDFLWEKSMDYSDWYSSKPKQEEIMQPGDYLFYHLSHRLEKEKPENDFIQSGLAIGANNSATLYVNVRDPENPFISNHAEYVYDGVVHVSGNIIYMNLLDDHRQEQVNIALVSFSGKNRFIGIITGLSTAHQPVAFKCACISQSLSPMIDYQKLKAVLGQHNREWEDSLMILEERDIDLFYSNRIMKA